MKLSVCKYISSSGILLFGLFVPILPRAYMICARANNSERISDVFGILHYPTLYFLTVVPFVFLSIFTWLILSKTTLSRDIVVKRVSGIGVSFIAMGYWGLGVSMPGVWGLGAFFFSFASILMLPLTYGYGGLIMYWIIKGMFLDQTKSFNENRVHVKSSKDETTLEKMFHKSRVIK
jgi:hypothetical protein